MSAANAAQWTEHRTPEGRLYWYHTTERRSVWEKPSELKTPRERALEATPWKEYKSGDRSYYVHSVTKQSTWTLPEELKDILDRYPVDGPSATLHVASPHVGSTQQSPAFARSPLAVPSPNPRIVQALPAAARSSHALSPNTPHGAASGSDTPLLTDPSTSRTNPSTLQSVSGNTELNFKGDKEAAEAAFLTLLSDTGVDVDWTWETTMRSIITNPLYKALKTIAERKAAFNKYLDNLRHKRAQESAVRLEKFKPLFKQLVDKDERIKSYSSFATVKKFLGDTPEWEKAKGDEEAREIYQVVMKEKRQAEKEEEIRIRKRNMDMLMALLKTFEADVFTRWRDAHRTILESQEYLDDPHLPAMEVSDMLVVFEDLIKGIEKETDVAKRQEMEAKRRKERQNRDAFKALLGNLEREGKIRARSTWGEVFPLIKDHDDFLRAVGQPGSSPLDLFFDRVDELDQHLEKQTADALQHASKSGHQVTPTTTETDFLSWTSASGVPEITLKHIYSELVAYLAEEEERKATEERRRLERKHRHKIEDLRYAFKKVDPALDLNADWDQVKQRVEGLSEYVEAMREDERVPKLAWDKFVRRQREKEAEAQLMASDESRKRKDHPDANTTSRRRSSTCASAGNGTAPVESEPMKKVKRNDDESEPEEGEV
ncbi:related to Formin binding protein 3 [Melanopsichium pennsylvanicum]|uniref:Related to Formin binding protein 3 n=2 Tax=Melanopsichium pennsylvanicum TaxID=63383 RepID=A0AAJ4XQQ8_9BASI|nr:related to Formin binding protein 3 [Melanopsichium pennsylvanicum]